MPGLVIDVATASKDLPDGHVLTYEFVAFCCSQHANGRNPTPYRLFSCESPGYDPTSPIPESMEPETLAETQVLLARYRGGDRDALQTLCQRYYPRIERMVRVRLGPARLARETVADVVQDVFVRVIESAERYQERSDARWIDYVARMAQNEISNHARRDRALKRGGALAQAVRMHVESARNWDVPAQTTSIDGKAAQAEETELIDRFLSDLTEPHREVILLRSYADCDWRTVAELMGRSSPEACQELFRRAQRALREKVLGRS